MNTPASQLGHAAFAVCAVVMSMALQGCAGTTTVDVPMRAPLLPTPLDGRLPGTIGVVFDPAFRTAHPTTASHDAGVDLVWRFQLGEASLSVFRQALAGTFETVIELDPDQPVPSGPGRVFGLLVPAPPTVAREGDSPLWRLRQEVDYPVRLESTSGALRAQWVIRGVAGVAAGSRWTGWEGVLERDSLRMAAAALVAALRRDLDPDAAAAGPVPVVPPRMSAGATVVLRLDAGLIQGDLLEERAWQCAGNPRSPSPSALRDALFPWLDPGVAPLGRGDIGALLARPAVRTRLAASGVARVLLFTVGDAGQSGDDSMFCGGGFGVGACLGHYVQRQRLAMVASLWDAGSASLLSEYRGEVVYSLGVVGVVLPVPYARTDDLPWCQALRRMAEPEVPGH